MQSAYLEVQDIPSLLWWDENRRHGEKQQQKQQQTVDWWKCEREKIPLYYTYSCWLTAQMLQIKGPRKNFVKAVETSFREISAEFVGVGEGEGEGGQGK